MLGWPAVEPVSTGGVPALAPRALAPRHGRGHRARPRALSHLSRASRRAPPEPSAACIERGEVVEIEVEGARGAGSRSRDLPALERAARRRRIARGRRSCRPSIRCSGTASGSSASSASTYRIEVYTPGPKRVHGYYTLPVLHDGQLIGRVDAKAHRPERRLGL